MADKVYTYSIHMSCKEADTHKAAVTITQSDHRFMDAYRDYLHNRGPKAFKGWEFGAGGQQAVFVAFEHIAYVFAKVIEEAA